MKVQVLVQPDAMVGGTNAVCRRTAHVCSQMPRRATPAQWRWDIISAKANEACVCAQYSMRVCAKAGKKAVVRGAAR